MADGPSRVIVWGTPRSLSTAFLKAMTHVEDSIMWFEPFLLAQRFGPDAQDREKFMERAKKVAATRGAKYEAVMEIARNLPFGYIGSEASCQWIKEQLEADAPDKKLIFVKDIVSSIVGRSEVIPEGFRHAFLLRHPIKSLTSFKKMAYANDPNVDLRKMDSKRIRPENVYKELFDFYHYLKKEKIDAKPIIICTDELQRNPEGVMKTFCKEMNIPFTEKLVKWDIEDEEIMQKWMIARESAVHQRHTGTHKNMFRSTGFQPPSALPDMSTLDEDIVEVAKKAMPYYEEMLKERMLVE